MTRHSLIKTCMVLFAALFLMVQGVAQAHATANGGVEHTHDGVACDIALIAAPQAVIAPAPIVPAPKVLPMQAADPIIPATPIYRHFDGRAPPPRGPPL